MYNLQININTIKKNRQDRRLGRILSLWYRDTSNMAYKKENRILEKILNNSLHI